MQRHAHACRPSSAARAAAVTALFAVLCLLCGCGGGPADEAAVEELTGRLSASDRAEREAAAHELLERADPRSAEALIAALEDESWLVRERAAEALGKIGDSRAVGPLKALLRDGEPGVRWRAAKALAAIGAPAVEALVSDLQSEDAESRRNAACALDEIEGMNVIVPLITELKRERFDEDVAEAVAVAGLSEALRSGDVAARRAAAGALGRNPSPRAVAVLITALDDADEIVRRRAAEVLGAIGAPAVDALLMALGSEEPTVRQGAAFALGTTRSEAAVQALIAALQDPAWSVRGAAAGALEKHWGPGKGALLSALNSADRNVRGRAVQDLLGMSDRDTAGQILVASLDGRTYYRVLQELSKHGQDAAHLLLVASTHGSPHVRQKAAQSLVALRHVSAVPASVNAMERQPEAVCRALAARLKSALGQGAVAPLVAELGREDARARYGVSQALASIGQPALDPLLKALGDDEARVRGSAAVALGLLKNPAAVKPLIDLLADDDEPVRLSAAAALQGITGQAFGDDRAAWLKWHGAANP